MQHRTLIALAPLLLAGHCATASISWSSTGTIVGPSSNVASPTNFTTPLTGNAANTSLGFFVQLIYAGPSGLPDPAAINTGDGVVAGANLSIAPPGVYDDVVVSTRWIGALHFTLPNGRFTAGSPWTGPQEVAGSKFFVRAWSAPAFDYNSGLVPQLPLVYYGNSALFTSPGPDINGDTIPDIQAFDAGAFTVNRLAVAIPEAGTAGLAGLGLLLLRRFLRRKTA